MHAPQEPWAQPFFVPVSPRRSRSRSSRLTHGWTASDSSAPLTRSRTSATSLLRSLGSAPWDRWIAGAELAERCQTSHSGRATPSISAATRERVLSVEIDGRADGELCQEHPLSEECMRSLSAVSDESPGQRAAPEAHRGLRAVVGVGTATAGVLASIAFVAASGCTCQQLPTASFAPSGVTARRQFPGLRVSRTPQPGPRTNRVCQLPHFKARAQLATLSTRPQRRR